MPLARWIDWPDLVFGATVNWTALPSSFTRWFIGQFGVPPAAWRSEHGPRKDK